MTISNTTNRTSATGSGAIGQDVAFEFPITDTSDLKVYSRVTATGVQTDLLETTNYTIEIDGDSGGTLTTVTAIADTAQIHIVRTIPYTQTLDLEAGGTFNAENIEDAVDKNTKLTVQLKDKVERMLRFPATDPAASVAEMPSSIDRASKYLYFGADGAPTAADSITPSDVTVSDYMEDVVDRNDEAALKAKINLEIGTDVQAQDAQLDDIAALAVTNSNFIVGDGTNWVAESGATARTSMGAAATTDLADYIHKNGSTAYTGTGVGFKDENDMASDSDTATASQQSIKKYVDTQLGFSAYTTEDSEPTDMLKNQVYLAATAGFVTALLALDAGKYLRGYVDTDSSPVDAANLIQETHPTGAAEVNCIMFPVAKGEYFIISTDDASSVAIRWKSVGTLSKPIDQT